jgi:hypothetical protein
LGDALRNAVGGAGDGHTAVAMADEHDIIQILPLDQVDDVGDMGVEIDRRTAKVRPLAQSSEGDGINVVAPRSQRSCDLRPAPPTHPGTADENKRRHGNASINTDTPVC